MSNDILFSVQNGIGIIQLNRPQALNALTHDMCIPLEQDLRSWAKDAAVKAVIIKGSGEKAFCAGGDIRKLADRSADGVQYRKSFWYDEYRCNTLIGEYPKPFIALIDGIFMGGGVGLSVHGSHRIISEFAHFAMPETGIGLFPDVGGTYFPPRCPGELGVYLGLTGAPEGRGYPDCRCRDAFRSACQHGGAGAGTDRGVARRQGRHRRRGGEVRRRSGPVTAGRAQG